MIDVHTIPTSMATLSGSASRRAGVVRIARPLTPGKYAQVGYPGVKPVGLHLWRSAELASSSVGTGSVRLRLVDGSGGQYWLDSAGVPKKVATTSSWESEYFEPHGLWLVEGWTDPHFELIVRLVRTLEDPDPWCSDLRLMVELPAWPGAVAQAVRQLADRVAAIRPILEHRETLEAEAQTFRLGEPYSERGFDLTELVQVTVDGAHKSATMAGGVVTLLGPAAPSGSDVRVHVRYAPNTSVSRVGEIRTVARTPAFVLSDLVSRGGLNGNLPPVGVSGLEVTRDAVELQVQVRGVAHRQADALAMRAALNEALDAGVQLDLDSGRTVYAAIVDTVQVLSAGAGAVPEALCVVRVPMQEFKAWRRTRNSGITTTKVTIRQDDDGGAEAAESSGDSTGFKNENC